MCGRGGAARANKPRGTPETPTVISHPPQRHDPVDALGNGDIFTATGALNMIKATGLTALSCAESAAGCRGCSDAASNRT